MPTRSRRGSSPRARRRCTSPCCPQSSQVNSAGRTLIALREAVGRKGTYALAVGDEFRTLGDGFDAAAAGDAARKAHPDDLEATLETFIDAAGKAQNDAGAGGSSAGAVIAIVILIVVLAGGAFLIFGRRRARRDGGADGRSEVGHIEQNDEFVRLGDSIRALELDVTLGDANPAAKADYDRASRPTAAPTTTTPRAPPPPPTRRSTRAWRRSPRPANASRAAAET